MKVTRSSGKFSIYSKPYIPILSAVCNNVSMKNVIKRVKTAKLLNVKLFNPLNVLEH